MRNEVRTVRRPDHRRRASPRSSTRSATTCAQLSAAASQLVSDFGGTIDGDAVARFHRGQAEVTGFTVAERVLVGDRAGLDRDAALGAASAGSPHVLIADAIADGVRTAARVASLSTTNPGELARMLKMPPWKVKKAQAQSRGWSIDGLQQAIGVTAELNADVKGAAASADYALERAVRRIVTIRAETGRAAGARRRPLTASRPRNANEPPSREGRGSFTSASRRTRGAGSEAGDLLGQTRLAVGGLVLVDDALAGGLVERLAGGREGGGRGGGVAGRRRRCGRAGPPSSGRTGPRRCADAPSRWS